VELFGVEILRGVLVAVIGPTTSESAKEAGLEIHVVAKQQTAESLVQGIVEHDGAS
jgi:uroporphyrinogen-III synthase